EFNLEQVCTFRGPAQSDRSGLSHLDRMIRKCDEGYRRPLFTGTRTAKLDHYPVALGHNGSLPTLCKRLTDSLHERPFVACLAFLDRLAPISVHCLSARLSDDCHAVIERIQVSYHSYCGTPHRRSAYDRNASAETYCAEGGARGAVLVYPCVWD